MRNVFRLLFLVKLLDAMVTPFFCCWLLNIFVLNLFKSNTFNTMLINVSVIQSLY